MKALRAAGLRRAHLNLADGGRVHDVSRRCLHHLFAAPFSTASRIPYLTEIFGFTSPCAVTRPLSARRRARALIR